MVTDGRTLNPEAYWVGWMKARWAVVPSAREDGGWCIILRKHLERRSDVPLPPAPALHEFPRELEDLARHTARVHNEWLERHKIDEEGTDDDAFLRATAAEDRAPES